MSISIYDHPMIRALVAVLIALVAAYPMNWSCRWLELRGVSVDWVGIVANLEAICLLTMEYLVIFYEKKPL
jgi:hypothetical protein